MVSDPISDFITRIKNASMVSKESVAIPYSKLKHAVAQKLEEHGYVGVVTKRGRKTRKFIEIELSYKENGSSRIQGVARVSKPGRRVYVSLSNIRPVRFGKGSLFISTPKGILTGDEARAEHVGGEALFKIW